MRSFFVFLLTFLFLYGYSQPKNFTDTAALYFAELKSVTEKNQALWGLDLYAPVLLVNPVTRETYANSSDTIGVLKKEGEVYTGVLPRNVNVANTAVRWGGKHWAMIMLPLSSNKQNRINLLTHELFHRAQTRLGFKSQNPDNNHLDKKQGRVYLRLELEALKKAIGATSGKEISKHIKHAFAFRQMRRSLFPAADSTENLLELNEGICEFTGMMMSGRTKAEQADQFIRRINEFINSTSYVRSFAYETIPVYGYLLSDSKKNWHRDIDSSTNLTGYFIKAFNIKNSEKLEELAKNYYGEQIETEESVREEKINRQLAEFRRKFIDGPHTEIPLQNMNMSFDYTRIVPLDDKGTVYPQIRITDNWGVLEVTDGALINTLWNQVNLGFPTVIGEHKISGDGWTLELKAGFMLEKDNNGKNYILRKN